MYTPKAYATQDLELGLRLISENPLALLLGPDSNGASFGTHVPLSAFQDEQGLYLEGHMARANPHWGWLSAQREMLAVFSGPSAYVSPSLYDAALAVPTWNYMALHAYGTLSLIDDAAAKDSLLKRLIDQHEPAYAEQWRAMPSDYQSKMLAAIVGFRVRVTRWEGKFKLSQNRSATERARIQASYAENDANPEAQALARWMGALGL
jgi:transcriptional regulator